MKIFSFFFVFFLFMMLPLSILAQEWEIQHIPGLPNSANSTLIFAPVNSDTVWGIQSTDQGVGNPKFILTTNGGGNWSLADVQIPQGHTVQSIYAVNATTAYIAVDDPAGSNSGIYKTTNSGTSWEKHTSAFLGSNRHPRQIYFFDNNNGLCIGNPSSFGYWEIYTTSDGGVNWVQVSQSNIPNVGDDVTFTTTSAGSGNSYWFGTCGRDLFRTTNRGLNWSVVQNAFYEPSGGFCGVDIAFKDPLNGIAVTYTGDLINRVYKTSDGGLNWSYPTTFPGLPSYYFLNHVSEDIYLVTARGTVGSPTNPGSAYTIDGGDSWHVIDDLIHGPAWSKDGYSWSGGINDIVYKISTDSFVVYPSIFIDPYNIDFESVIIGDSSDIKSILISNTGSQSFTINSITTNRLSYVLSDLPSFPKKVFPGDSVIFKVVFVPAFHGTESGDIIISTNFNSDINIFLTGHGILFGNQFHAFYNRVNNAPVQERTAIVDSFWNANPVMPFTEQDSICQFIYRGNATSVSVPGDANDWAVNGFPMDVLSTTDLWYRSEIFEPDARLEYKFVIDGTLWITDPRNPRIVGGYENSELRMPAYIQPAELLYYPNIPHGILYDTTFYSTNLGNSRPIRVYLPPGYSTSESYPLVVFHDGLAYIAEAYANNVLDYLISQNRIQPLIGVFVPPVNRDEEYVGSLQNQFAAFIAEELIPYIDVRYRTMLNADKRATVGISNGGNIALWIAYNYPNVFGLTGSYSGNIQYTTSSAFETGIKESLKIYIDAGTYDLPGFLTLTQNFRDIIQDKGYDFRYNEWHEGHSWLNWGAHLDNALEFFFPDSTVGVQDESILPNSFVLMQNYPNPFNPSTVISYQLPVTGFVSLKVYDVLGSEVATLINEEKPAGSYEVEFNAAKLSSGIYFYTLQAGSYTQTKKLILMK
ncbi:MAG: hypothetical protein DAHOPDDO_03426 [Ignavibacteriaceae bacterium]|nr:hypothetical protein [Ignavibacteriaceae bacterium]